MKLTGIEITDRIADGDLAITPFDAEQVSPNSYDLRLASELECYTEAVLDPERDNPTARVAIPEDGLVLPAGSFWIGHSVEHVTLREHVAFVHAKSGIARLGVIVHGTADLIAAGHDGPIEFHISPLVDVRVTPHMRLAQLSFEVSPGYTP